MARGRLIKRRFYHRKVCTLLAYQTTLIQHSYMLRVALIQYLFTCVVPLPLAYNHPRIAQCMYKQAAIRYEGQLEILRLVHHLSAHFAACTMSLAGRDRALDSTRVLTLGCMTCVGAFFIYFILFRKERHHCSHKESRSI